MSADLFAQFGPGSGSQSSSRQQDQRIQQPQHQQHQQQQPDDPFAFLSTALSQPLSPSPKTSQQPQTSQLWPAHGNPGPPAPVAANSWTGSAWTSTPIATTTAAKNDNDDEDAWGDFEDASPSQAPATAPVPAPAPALAWPAPQPGSPAPPVISPAQPPPRTRIVRANTMDLLTNTLIGVGDSQPAQKKPPNPNVLFDAEEVYDTQDSLDGNGDVDDEFGDFETGQASPPHLTPAPVSVAAPAPTPAPVASPVTRIAAPRKAGPALVDLLSLSDLDLGPSPPAAASPPAGQHTSPQNIGFNPSPQLSSLTPSATRKPQPPNLLSPLSFGSSATAERSSHPPPQKSPSFQDRNPFPGLAVTTPLSAEFPKDKVEQRTPSPVTAWPTLETLTSSAAVGKGNGPKNELIDSWDAWDSVDSNSSQHNASQNKQDALAPGTVATSSSDWDWDVDTADTTSRAEPDGTTSPSLPPAIANIPAAKTLPEGVPPPTNVPPPAVLLSLFLELIALPDDALFKPIAAQSTEVRSRILGHAKTVSFLRNYLELVLVAARVVAGRKQRWHRDKFLKQSMSISAAGSSKGSGMKLTGLDKAQGQREDREAADVVAAWHRQVGKLRSAVVTVNAALAAATATEHKYHAPLTIPDLQSATVPVTTAKQVPTAPRPCVVCGLRRDERLRGIDPDDVQDLFGEWWVEHWGHRTCRNFWIEHEATLRSR